eukprot:Hpha_TRINITY_DN5956_c0_g1::TRINITY_DN5956_c0_g1_i2::g.147207::m.147207
MPPKNPSQRKLRPGVKREYTAEEMRARLFETIQSAQDGVSHTSYKTALREMKQGAKKTHWIWYIFPSLKALRPGTQRPHFLLPDFDTVRRYLEAPVLSDRLEEITGVVLEQLKANTPLSTLMGGGTDARKFRECATVFSMAAAVGTHPRARDQCALFCGCLDEAERVEPAWKTATLRVEAMKRGGDGRGNAARRAYASAPGRRTT